MEQQKKVGAAGRSAAASRTRKITISLFEGREEARVRDVIEEREIAFHELPKYIEKQTYSLIQFKKRVRNQVNFLRSGCVALDVDGGLSMRDAISRLKKSRLQSIVAPTRNHQREKVKGSGGRIPACDRYRILILLSRDVENEPDHRETVEALRKIFPESDPLTKDGARIFFPSLHTAFRQLDGVSFDPVSSHILNMKPKAQRKLGAGRGGVAAASGASVVSGINPKAARRRAMQFLLEHDSAVEGCGGDTHTLKTAMRLYDFGIQTAEECCRTMEESGWNDRCDPPWTANELLQKCRNARRSRQDPIGSAAPEAIFAEGKESGDSKPTIIVGKGDLHQLVGEAERALVHAGANLYARGPDLVVPIVDEIEAGRGRRAQIMRLKDANSCLVRLRLSESAHWQKWDSRQKKRVKTDPPRDVAESILERDGLWTFPKLAGVITCPTLRPDGSILSTEGYDLATRLLLLGAPSMPDLPERPTKDDAFKALSDLEGLLVDFPYADDASKSVALSMLITPVIRGALSCAPLHAVRATAAGTGKSFSTDLASYIVSGQSCPVMTAGRNDEETEKRLGAVVRTGQPIINIDNVNGELGGDMLCQLIDRPIVQIRPLGRSETIQIENKATFFATGNGIVLVGDMARRVLLCSLDANVERPELRKFTGNPVEKVLADRGRYIGSALTVVRAYWEAGFPGELQSLGSFGDWSRVVRSALVWLGKEDPVKTMEQVRADDPRALQFDQVISAWKRVYGVNNSITAGELARQDSPRFPVTCEHGKMKVDAGASFDCTICDTAAGTEFCQRLRAALQDVAPDRLGQAVDPSRLGKWLSSNNGKIAMGVKLIRDYDKHKEKNEWYLAPFAGGISNDQYEKCQTGIVKDSSTKAPSMVGNGGRR